MGRERRRSRKHNKQNRMVSPYLSMPKRQITNPHPPYEIATEAQIARIHDASMKILENTGIRFMDDEAMALWDAAGAKVDHKMQHVWPDRGLIAELIAKAPTSFTARARNPVNNRIIGGNNINFYPNAGMVFVRDLQRGRRPGVREDLSDLNKLAQLTNVISFAALMGVVMHDVAVNDKHLQNLWLGFTRTDKINMAISHGPIIVEDAIEMCKIVFGDDLKPEEGPVTGGIINANSPLVFDDRMLGGSMTFARHGQFTIVTPFILAGAMSPVTMLAAIAQNNAEALAGIALLQLVNPGSPAVYGGFTTNVDMKSGSPAFGTPEGAWAHFMGSQLARHYKLPYRGSGGLNTANIPDAQAAAESQWSLWPCVMGHANFVAHATGWLESGLTVSFEKYVMDAENVAMMQHFLQGPDWEDDAFALEAIDEVGPAGHHFGTAHTQARYQTAFYPNFIHDRRNHGTWVEAGSEDTVVRANKLYRQLLRDYEPPLLDVGIRDELLDFIARRRQELDGVELYD